MTAAFPTVPRPADPSMRTTLVLSVIMHGAAAALWLASSLSDGVTGCRFVAKDWDPSLSPDAAAESAREPAIFLPPARSGPLGRTWKARGKGG